MTSSGMWKILMFEISVKEDLCYVIWGSEVKTSDLAAHFSRNSGAANTVLFTFFEFSIPASRSYGQGKGKLLAGNLPGLCFTLQHAQPAMVFRCKRIV